MNKLFLAISNTFFLFFFSAAPIFIIIILVYAVFNIPLGHPKPPADENGTYPVEAVYLNEPGSYSVAELKDGKIDVHHVGGWDRGTCPTLIPDVPIGTKNYVAWHHHYDHTAWNQMSDEKWIQSIHIHSIDDLQGAGWNRGKFGSGTTNKIQ